MISCAGVLPFERELAVAEDAARRAGAVILAHYTAVETPFSAKADGSPLSSADLEANAVVLATLAAAFPDDAVLSEESADDHRRLDRERVWIVDPLDGTRGFLARTGDFGVNVALVMGGVPTVGVVYQPAEDVLYRALAGRGAFAAKAGTTRRLRCSNRASLGELRIGLSRHNAPAPLLAWLEQHRLAAASVRVGACGKYTGLADGTLDALVTVTRSEMEWDTCAPGLIVEEAGGVVSDGEGQPLRYNQAPGALARRRGVVASNGRCHAELIALLAPLLQEEPAP